MPAISAFLAAVPPKPVMSYSDLSEGFRWTRQASWPWQPPDVAPSANFRQLCYKCHRISGYGPPMTRVRRRLVARVRSRSCSIPAAFTLQLAAKRLQVVGFGAQD